MSVPNITWPAMAASIDYYDAYNSSDKCFLAAPRHIFQTYVTIAKCHKNFSHIGSKSEMPLDIKSWETIGESVHSMMTIMPTLLAISFSHICFRNKALNTVKRFMSEFLMIIGSAIFFIAADKYINVYTVIMSMLLLLYMWRSRFWQDAANCTYHVGSRPIVFTLLRATTYIGTCSAILAIDFEKVTSGDYHKSRQFGASCMDMGIGMFVFNMGTVSRRAEGVRDLLKLYKTVIPLMVLGLGRIMVISMLDYHYDDKEYGRHWNAFIALAIAKLIGSLCSLLARSNNQLLPLSLGITLLHELSLQLGLNEFVMSSETGRDNWLTANREGLSAVPGTAALYLLGIYFGKWYKANQQLSYAEMQHKLLHLLIIVIGGWLMTFTSAYITGIARVTFNAGYIIWIFTVCATCMLLFASIFEFAFSTILTRLQDDKQQQQELLQEMSPAAGDQLKSTALSVVQVPQLLESINLNGLIFFMLANFLTGFVNMSMEPDLYDAPGYLIIMLCYLLASNAVPYILYRLHIRIA